jgi:polyisoprenoid-binding protein YceI
MIHMRKLTFIVVASLFILAGCASQATPSPTEPAVAAPTQAVAQPTGAPTSAPSEASGETQPPDPAQASGPLELSIVPGESSVSYEVGETFFNQNNRFNVAVGTTTQLSGKINIDPANPQNSSIDKIEVDISQLQSDSGRRDNMIRDRFLESRQFPIATFVANQIEGLPTIYSEGQTLNFKVSGDLTVHEVTKPVTFDVQATLANHELQGTATTTLLMSDFGVGPIEMAGILGTEDEFKIHMQFVAR